MIDIEYTLFVFVKMKSNKVNKEQKYETNISRPRHFQSLLLHFEYRLQVMVSGYFQISLSDVAELCLESIW